MLLCQTIKSIATPNSFYQKHDIAFTWDIIRIRFKRTNLSIDGLYKTKAKSFAIFVTFPWKLIHFGNKQQTD